MKLNLHVDGECSLGEEFISFGQRLADLARVHPDEPAITYIANDDVPETFTWRALDALVSVFAKYLQDCGAKPGDAVGVQLPNGPLHIVAALGIWRLGGRVLLLGPRMPASERDLLCRYVECDLVIAATTDDDRVLMVDFDRIRVDAADADFPSLAIPSAMPRPGKYSPTGGSTGRPKLIGHDRPWGAVPGKVWEGVAQKVGFHPKQTHLVPGPLYHNAPFTWCHYGLFEDQHIVLLESFNSKRVLDCLEMYRVSFLMVVPTMLKRLLGVTDIRERDFSSLHAMYHTGGPCARWLKREWLSILGPERVTEMYGSTEDVGQTIVDGIEWEQRPGTVGRPFRTEVRIQAEDGTEAATGELGEIYMRPTDRVPDFFYLGEDDVIAKNWDGHYSVGDMGYVDADGYLFISDRQVDVINSGGVRVLPAEVEAVLLQHPSVRDAVVVGLPDDTWGNNIHAVVEPELAHAPCDEETLLKHCRAHLSPEKAPKSFRFADSLPRNEFGKLRRSAVLESELSLETVAPPLRVEPAEDED